MLFDAGRLGRAWLAVTQASGDDDEEPLLYRTVSVDLFGNGVRLAATDKCVLLHAWVPEHESSMDDGPSPDEVPIVAAVARDLHGRAGGLLKHLLKLAKAAEKDEDGGETPLVRLTIGTAEASSGTFDGMEGPSVTLDHPDHERVVLDVMELPFPNWPRMTAGFSLAPTKTVAWTPRVIGVLVKAASFFDWLVPIECQFAGPKAGALVDLVGSDPAVAGMIMPTLARRGAS